jgi:hypothetical protein
MSQGLGVFGVGGFLGIVLRGNMAKKSSDDIDGTKRLMAALGRMPPKPHEEMKVGKPKSKPKKSPPQSTRKKSSR